MARNDERGTHCLGMRQENNEIGFASSGAEMQGCQGQRSRVRCCSGIRLPKKLICFPRMYVRDKGSTGSLGRKVFQGQLWHRSSSVLAVLDSCHQAMSCVPCPAPMAQLWAGSSKPALLPSPNTPWSSYLCASHIAPFLAAGRGAWAVGLLRGMLITSEPWWSSASGGWVRNHSTFCAGVSQQDH